eukprot:Nk52_evm3s1129 gene=Nk52_evmTU3s1129
MAYGTTRSAKFAQRPVSVLKPCSGLLGLCCAIDLTRCLQIVCFEFVFYIKLWKKVLSRFQSFSFGIDLPVSDIRFANSLSAQMSNTICRLTDFKVLRPVSIGVSSACSWIPKRGVRTSKRSEKSPRLTTIGKLIQARAPLEPGTVFIHSKTGYRGVIIDTEDDKRNNVANQRYLVFIQSSDLQKGESCMKYVSHEQVHPYLAEGPLIGFPIHKHEEIPFKGFEKGKYV